MEINFQNCLQGNLEFVFKHCSHDIKYSNELIDLLDKLRSTRKEYCKNIIKITQEFQKLADHECLYGQTKQAVCQLLVSVQEEADGQMKTVDVLSQSIEEYRTKMKEIEKSSKSYREDCEKRVKEIEKVKENAKKEREKFVKIQKDLKDQEKEIEKGKQSNIKEKKLKEMEEKRENIIKKKEEQRGVYTNYVETSNKRIKTFFEKDQIEMLEMYNKFEVSYVDATKELLNKYAQSMVNIPGIIKEATEHFTSKSEQIDTQNDIKTFCSMNNTYCHTPTYIPIFDEFGVIVKQEGALGLRREDDPKDMERVYLTCEVLKDFVAEGPEEMSVSKGEIIVVAEKHGNGWWYATNNETKKGGFVPSTYLKDLN